MMTRSREYDRKKSLQEAKDKLTDSERKDYEQYKQRMQQDVPFEKLSPEEQKIYQDLMNMAKQKFPQTQSPQQQTPSGGKPSDGY